MAQRRKEEDKEGLKLEAAWFVEQHTRRIPPFSGR
jgi:hypothetical protein